MIIILKLMIIILVIIIITINYPQLCTNSKNYKRSWFHTHTIQLRWYYYNNYYKRWRYATRLSWGHTLRLRLRLTFTSTKSWPQIFKMTGTYTCTVTSENKTKLENLCKTPSKLLEVYTIALYLQHYLQHLQLEYI